MTTYDLAVNNGLVVNATHKELANIAVQDGKIVTISKEPLAGKETIDAKDNGSSPALVDTHIHFALKQGQGDSAVMTEDDYTSGPIASVGGRGDHLCGLRHLPAEPHAQGFPAGAHGAGGKGQLH